MKKMKKGFTIVELVIVIAVIAILAGVLIPTFTSVTENAKKSAALQEATSAVTAITVYDIDATDDKDVGTEYVIKSGNYYFVVSGGQIDTVAKTALPDGYSDTPLTTTIDGIDAGKISIYKKAPANP